MADEELASAIERYHEGGAALVNGDSEPQKAVFSQREDVCLLNPFGVIARGWAATAATIDEAAARFVEGEMAFECIAQHVVGELASITEIERWRARLATHDASAGELRVTSVLRPENGTWKVVLRHADAVASHSPDSHS